MAKLFGSNLLGWLRDYFLVKRFQKPLEKKPLSFLVEGETISLKDFEKKFAISYFSQLEFQNDSCYRALIRKVMRYDRRGFLDLEQKWLGAYFKKELAAQTAPLVCLRWINSEVGWGVFAERDLKPLELIGEYTGVVRKRKRKDQKNSYCFEVAVAKGESTRYVIDAESQGNLSRFLNHSARPNLSSALALIDGFPHVIFYTKRFIAQGEQLCYDYGPDYWKKRVAPQEFIKML